MDSSQRAEKRVMTEVSVTYTVLAGSLMHPFLRTEKRVMSEVSVTYTVVAGRLVDPFQRAEKRVMSEDSVTYAAVAASLVPCGLDDRHDTPLASLSCVLDDMDDILRVDFVWLRPRRQG